LYFVRFGVATSDKKVVGVFVRFRCAASIFTQYANTHRHRGRQRDRQRETDMRQGREDGGGNTLLVMLL
jgi:hypothetical protein